MRNPLKSITAVALVTSGLFGVLTLPASAAAKKTTITCYRLTPTRLLTLKVTALKPVCPANYTKTMPNIQGSGIAGDTDLNVPGSTTLAINGSSFDALFVGATTSGSTAYSAGGKVSFSSYPAAGSGTGRTSVTSGTTNIGFSDIPMAVSASSVPSGVTPSDYAQVPYVLGGGVVAYNLGSGFDGVKLTATEIYDIYNGTITLWSDPQIVATNGGTSSTLGNALAGLAGQSKDTIKVVYRAASSGTTYAFTDYLNKATGGTAPIEPGGAVMEGSGGKYGAKNILGAANNAALATDIGNNFGAIGYVEYGYLLIPGNGQLQTAQLQDKNGSWLSPNLGDIANAATAAGSNITPENFSIAYEPGVNVWPFATYSWAIVKKNQTDATAGEAAVKYLDWATHYGQKALATANGYVPLPAAAQAYARTQLLSVTSNGTVLLNQKN